MAEKPNPTTTAKPTPPIIAPARPTITLPPRPSVDFLFAGGFSPGPMTLISSFFPENNPDSDCRTFSQLLAGAMASPAARPALVADSSLPISNPSSSKQDASGNNSNLGFKQSRPMNLVVAHSPLFTVPPGLSPSGLLNSPGFFSPPQSPFGMSHQQALAQVTAQAALAAQSQMHLQAQYQPLQVQAPIELSKDNTSLAPSGALQQQTLPSVSEPQRQQPISVDKPSDDGYNWRKYGQKPIKGSEYPRSYYKCTHLNCPVKKKVERSSGGQITEIIYKGMHNHEPPQPSKRAKDSDDQIGNTNSQSKPESSSQNEGVNVKRSSETRDQESTQVDPTEPPAGSSDSEEAGDGALREGGGEDEPNPKRRQIDAETSEVTLPHKTVTEAKIIVQTRSEVDLLDDGYRWRKYGQKVVKGNPHPRSYYKCTSTGCNVRKHVERAAADPKAVITTYEGKHNHDVPASRHGSHATANSNALQVKPQKEVPNENSLFQGMDFGNSDQRPVLLRLKEEETAV